MRYFFSRTTIHMSIFEFIWFPDSDMRRQKKWEIHWKFVVMKRTHFFETRLFCCHLTVRTKVQEINVCGTWRSLSKLSMHLIHLTFGMCSGTFFCAIDFIRISIDWQTDAILDTSKMEQHCPLHFFHLIKWPFVHLKFALFFEIFDKNSSFNLLP